MSKPIKKVPTILIPRGIRATPRQVQVVRALLENGGTKADALRAANYSPTMVKNPAKVFNSRAIVAILDAMGLGEASLAERHKELLGAVYLNHMTFPTYNVEKAKERIEEDKKEGTDQSETIRGEQLTDQEIVEMLAEVNCTVKKIIHGEMARHVYFWASNTKAQLTALDMAYNLHGSYAPKKLDTKNSTTLGVYSLAKLRKKMQDNHIKVTDVTVVEGEDSTLTTDENAR